MQVEDILTQERCHSRVAGVSKKRVLTIISEYLAQECGPLTSDSVFAALMAREQLGSTGLGNGIAIPHCRVSKCPGIIGMLITLDEPIDFDAIDGKPVDVLFALIVPDEETDEHVKTLAHLAELFSDPDFCYTLRQTQDDEDLYHIAIMY